MIGYLSFSLPSYICSLSLFSNTLTLNPKLKMADDVVEYILTRLDVKDLVCCKSVCKSWYSLISSPCFVRAHLKHHKSNCNTRINNNDVGHTRIALATVWKIPDDYLGDENMYQINEWKLVGSSNGLVCVTFLLREDHDALILLINPWTREVREVPMPTIPPKEVTHEHDISLSFGYDSSTDDYKLLMGINRERVEGSIVKVFSLKAMTWKLIGHVNYSILYGKPGVLLNGAFHWFAFDYSIKKNRLVLLSFDISREEYKAIRLPDDSRYEVPYSTLGIFQNNLCMSCVGENLFYYGVWVMPNYNSWEFLPNDYEIKSPDAIYYMKLYDCTSPTKKRMGFCCDDKPCLSRSVKHTISDPIYVQSLVSPYVNTKIPRHAGSAKVAEREIQEMHIFVRTRKRNGYYHDEKLLRKMVEIYKREGGENEKSYLREDGETKRKENSNINMSKKIHVQEKRKIVEILAKEECVTQSSLFAESGMNKRRV